MSPVLTLSELRAGLTTSLAVCSPLTKAFFLELLFLRQTFSLLLHTLFPAEEPLTEPSQAHFRQCHFFLLTFFAFSVGVFSRLKEQKKPFCSTSLQVSVYAGSLLQNVFNIWMKELLLLSDSSVFSLMPCICNVKQSISLWKVLNLFLPFILVLCWIIFRSWLSTVNYFLSSLSR